MTLFQEKFEELHKELNIEVYAKDQKYADMWYLIGRFLTFISFGKMSTFYTNFTTTLGRGIYFSAGWRIEDADDGDYEVLRHEAKHVRQFIKLGLGSAKLGILVMGFLYLFVFLPAGLAWFRYKLEREAYLESCYARIDLGLNPNIDHCVELLSGPAYLWAWPFPKKIRRWFKDNLKTS